jgi:hypothetical protein
MNTPEILKTLERILQIAENTDRKVDALLDSIDNLKNRVLILESTTK